MFSFQQVTEEHVRQAILTIDGFKATPVGDIPSYMLNVTLDIYHLSFENGCLQGHLKLAEVSTIFKKNNNLNKKL